MGKSLPKKREKPDGEGLPTDVTAELLLSYGIVSCKDDIKPRYSYINFLGSHLYFSRNHQVVYKSECVLSRGPLWAPGLIALLRILRAEDP
jgi:hypothetical protein